MNVDLFDKVEQVTENPEHLIRIFLPHLRGLSYFAEKSINQDSKFEITHILEFIQLIPESRLSALVSEINKLHIFLLSKESNDSEQLSDTLKHYLFITSHISLLKHYVGNVISFISKFFGSKEQEDSLETHIMSIKDKTKNIFLSTKDNRYSKQVNNFTFIGYFSIGTCLLFRLAERLHCQWGQKDLLRFSLVCCLSRMEFELRNLHRLQWLPMLVNFLAQNGGRFFRLCCVNFGNKNIPLYKTISNSLILNRAISPEWHDTLYKEIQNTESLNNIGLNRLFIFYIADEFITNSLSSQDSYINAIKLLCPYPSLHTLKRYFNLFLQPDLYSSCVDTKTWQPPFLIKDYICSVEMSYEKKEQVLREEYFPQEIYDLNALLNYTAEYYNEKIHLDFEYENVSDLKKLDNNSIWYLSEWLVKERQYTFLHNISVNKIANMIGNKITSRE